MSEYQKLLDEAHAYERELRRRVSALRAGCHHAAHGAGEGVRLGCGRLVRHCRNCGAEVEAVPPRPPEEADRAVR